MADARRVGAALTIAFAFSASCGSSAARAQGLPGLGGGGLGGGLPGVGGLGAPIAPAIGGAAAPLAAATTAVPAVATQPTIWGFFGLSKDNLAACHQSIEACRAKICQTPIGQVLNGATLPFGAISGGLIPPICPPAPTAAQLAQEVAAGGAQGVAATIKAEEAKAKAKIAALAYLATVDCGVWPEAEKAIIDALRLDRNECVRFAAARGLANGCCCTEKTAAALTKVLDGLTDDGGILERSERVKSASFLALTHCVNRYIPRPKRRPESPPAPTRPELPAAALPPDALPGDAELASYLGSYYAKVSQRPDEVVIAEARAALGRASGAPLGARTMPTGSRSVYHALVKANRTGNPALPPSSVTPSPRLGPDEAPPPPVIALDRGVARAGSGDAEAQPPASPPPPPAIPATLPTPDSVPPPPIPPTIPEPETATEEEAPAGIPLPPLPPAPQGTGAAPARPLTPAPVSAAPAVRPGVPPSGQRSLFQILAASRRPRGG